MFDATQLICHALGDYVLQSDWMANQKTKSHIPALVHAFAYSIPFWFLKPSPLALVVIISTHFVIDRWRLARYVCWAKNWLCPFWVEIKELEYVNTPELRGHIIKGYKRKFVSAWSECTATDYPPGTPPFLAVWLLIITDNLMHIVINALALRYL